MAMTALDEIRSKVMNVMRTMLKTSVCFGHAGLMLRMKPYVIKNAAKVSASEIMKIHIMNLLHDVPKGDLPPPQSEASIRCCSAKLESINYPTLPRGLKPPGYHFSSRSFPSLKVVRRLQPPEFQASTSKMNRYTHKASMKCQY